MATGPIAPRTAATIAWERWVTKGSSLLVTTAPGTALAMNGPGRCMPLPCAPRALRMVGKARTVSSAWARVSRPVVSGSSKPNSRRRSCSRRLSAVKVARSVRIGGGGGSSKKPGG